MVRVLSTGYQMNHLVSSFVCWDPDLAQRKDLAFLEHKKANQNGEIIAEPVVSERSLGTTIIPTVSPEW